MPFLGSPLHLPVRELPTVRDVLDSLPDGTVVTEAMPEPIRQEE